ncbi:MAG: aromatic acid decarboxylase [Candidatus Omnitrophica bacterium CG11_big_fil_rev_8_21_14_0_20_45_26]|uniref:Flavin prenyltransferase UbiX n=1 Tax=Candidatus Abzuiibacterium crystallinum TaxID=1974748 RepID=A0A2H0LSR5_9BACT|nr:MAG: aromatic acid decarboxylase [Candidatus Omnitrophica bacterium CG11_big_fil_rev_8_21_14_0_20_45_26]PIW65328.1 MAG: aromatic acid decarboxylase [Candidatus Omnitrophica bacterium CG12_big_fil_rev_8_21_14_0_65_45_16]
MSKQKKPFVVAITGASGAVYGVRLMEVLAQAGESIAFTMSNPAKTVIQEEMGINLGHLENPDLYRLWQPEILKQITYYHHGDFTAPIASGSYPTKGMFVVPCATTSLARIATGISQTLVERAAECIIKEGRKLVLVPRETPLSAIHLENMLKLARLGVHIVPAMPGFYAGLKDIQETVDFVVGKALDVMDVPHSLFRRWIGSVRSEDYQNFEKH